MEAVKDLRFTLATAISVLSYEVGEDVFSTAFVFPGCRTNVLVALCFALEGAAC